MKYFISQIINMIEIQNFTGNQNIIIFLYPYLIRHVSWE